MKRVDPDSRRPNPWVWPVDYFIPPEILSANSDIRTRARILVATSLAGGLMTTASALLDRILSGVATGVAFTNLIGGFVIFLGAFLLKRSGSLVLTANLLLLVGWAMNTILYLASAGTNVSSLYAFSIVPLLAMLIGGVRVGLLWTAICCATIVGLIFSPGTLLPLPVSFAVIDLETHLIRDVVVIMIWLAMLGGVFDWVRRNAQRGAEQALGRAEQSERRFALTFDANPDGIVIADAMTREIEECNEGFLSILGLPRQQVVGRLDWTAALEMDESQREEVEKTLRESGRAGDVEVSLSNRNGDDLALRVHANQFEVDGHLCILAAVRDVTERVRLEGQLRQSQKMEAVGQMAGAIAHDFNNMLTVIAGYAQHLSAELDGELREMSGEIQDAADRSAELTRQLLAFSRRQVLDPQLLDLNEMVQRLEVLLERLIGETIEIRTDLEAGLGSVRADPGQIEQVIVNLAINARDAMSEGGRLSIETRNFRGRPGNTDHEGDFVCLRIRDSGCGMDETTLTRVFEPFFTTKEPGKGTGLGLSTVEGIVSQSGGEISIQSLQGEGTVVEIFLPRRSPDIANGPRMSARIPGETSTGSGHQILLVEDDEMVRRLVSRSLRGGGYRVLEASDGDEALEVFSGREDEIDLVLTDMVMPRRGGLELARGIREIRPTVPVLFMSGYPNPREGQGQPMPEGEELIQKPFSPEALRGRIADLLREHAD